MLTEPDANPSSGAPIIDHRIWNITDRKQRP